MINIQNSEYKNIKKECEENSVSAKRKVTTLRQAVEKKKKKKGITYNAWKQNVIEQKKMAVLTDKDKEWLDEAEKQASLELIMESVIGEEKNTERPKDHSSNANVTE